jgi:UDP-N-acetylmuramyl pentapeptide synthase
MAQKILIVDMTHGGVEIALEFSKLHFKVYAWDIYHTLDKEQKKKLLNSKIELVDEDFLEGDKPLVVAPVHCKLEYQVDMTHHQAVAHLMEKRIDIPFIEITGVKGKTSIVYMLKEIFKEKNPLILSSLGIEVMHQNQWKLLKRDVSITPASIITAWKLGRKYKPGIYIAETSLGGTGLAQVGILTNIAEDYSIASGEKKASMAKKQIFKNKFVVCEHQALKKFYPQYTENVNTFGLTEGNVKVNSLTYGLTKTVMDIEVKKLKTNTGEVLTENFRIKTFAPAPHHAENVLSSICASLTFGASINNIIGGLNNFHGLKGRSSLKILDNSVLIEEINPGINVTAVSRALDMVKDLPESVVIFGGQYGVTCEEIDEEKVANVLNRLDEKTELLLTDELGYNINRLVKRKFKYIEIMDDAVKYSTDNNYKRILLIYRSNYPDINHR